MKLIRVSRIFQNTGIAEMSLISRNFKVLRPLGGVYCPAIHSRSIGDVGKSNDVNIFDVFHSKKLQKERAAKR